MTNINWELFKKLTDDVPEGLLKSKKKATVQLKTRELVFKLDNACKLCGAESRADTNGLDILQIHHIIPNGDAGLGNLVVLCKYCHQIVHHVLYVTKKWRYVNVLAKMPWF